METRGKISESNSVEKKLAEYAQNEKRLISGLDEVKLSREKKMHEYQKQLEKEKENFRVKLSESEQKAKEAEGRRASLIFEFEKERAKWALERDHILSSKIE